MSFFSMSSKRSHYRNGHHGSQHYQREGFLGRLFNDLASRSGGGYYYDNNGRNPYPNGQPGPYPNQPLDPYQSQQPNPNQPPLNSPYQSQLVCSNCNAQIPAGSKFCLNCGNKVNEALFCTNCGENLPKDAKFCLKCGTKING